MELDDGYLSNYIGGGENLEELKELAEEELNSNPAPYRVYIVNNKTGEVVFYKAKRSD